MVAPAAAKHVIAVDMIQVIVRVNDKTNRQRRELANLAEQRLRRPRILERVDHQNAVVADHKSGVAARQPLVVHNRGPNSIADFLQLKVRNGSVRRNENQERNSQPWRHPARLTWDLRESCKVG